MKQLISKMTIIVYIAIIMSIAGCSKQVPQEEPRVLFHDEVFQAMFDRMRYQEEGLVYFNQTKSNLEKITALKLSFPGNQSSCLKDLDKFPNLRGLLIRNANEEELYQIGQLQQVKALQIIVGHTPVDMSSLGGMKNIKSLDLQGNISGSSKDNNQDWSFIKEMEQLESLTIDYTKFADLELLTGLPKLERLVIRNAEIDDITSLKELKNLKYLYITEDNKNDYAKELRHLPQLEQLAIEEVKLTDLSFLQDMNNLNWLTIEGVGITTLPNWLTAENYPQLAVLNVDEDIEKANIGLLEKLMPVLEERDEIADTQPKFDDIRNNYSSWLEYMEPVEVYDQ